MHYNYNYLSLAINYVINYFNNQLLYNTGHCTAVEVRVKLCDADQASLRDMSAYSGIILLMLSVTAVVLVTGPSLTVTANFYGKRGKLRNSLL